MATAASDTAAFEAAVAALHARDRDSWLQPLRERGLARFRELGLPTTRLEDWKSTSVAALAKIPFHAADEPDSSAALTAESWLPRGLAGPRIALVNGRCAPELSRGVARADGLRVRGLCAATREERELLAPRLDAQAGAMDRAFAALNAAMLEDGAFIRVPRGVVVEEPIHVLHVMAAAGEPVGVHPRTVIVLEEGAEATVVETHAGHEGETLTNAVTEIHVGAGARLEHVHVQRQSAAAFHVSTTVATLGRDASLASRAFTLGARLSRHDLDVVLAGEGASCRLDGLAFLASSQHADHHVFVHHAAPRGTSEQLFKYACAGRSRGVFRGRIRVDREAPGTSAHQQSRNLILSDDALVDTKPQLEISTDDVRCTHGATIGQLEPDQLFYLRARGLDEAEARRLLVHAFADEMIGRVGSVPLREELARALEARHREAGT